ncbi:MAG: ATP-binding protein, partial [Fidelibacterota bacterium]
LQVKDNGRGITRRDIFNPESFGLLGMRERIHPWGGEVDVEGEKGKGTTVTVNFPAAALQRE